MSPLRVVVADDDTELRSALSEILDQDDRFEIAAQVADGHSLVDVVTRTDADVVLLDVRMPGGGLAAVEALREHHAVAVVVVSGETRTTLIRQLLAAGVRGYLAKSRLGASLPDDIARCLGGEVVVTDPVVARVMERRGQDGWPDPSSVDAEAD